MAQLESGALHPDTLPHAGDLTAVARAARADLDAAVEAIRRVPGYEQFLEPPTFADVQGALTPMAGTGGLVYLTTTPEGSLALIVYAGGVEEVWLTCTEADLHAFLVQHTGEEVTGGYLPGQLGNHAWLEESLAAALPWLGERVMAPVATRLHALGLAQVVLIPAGRLGLLPLHAACYPICPQCRTPLEAREGHDVPLSWCPTCDQEVVDPLPMYFLDEFAVSYAPNARTLITAQHEARRRSAIPVLVGVGNPSNDLLAAQAELEELATFFPEGVRYALYTDDATRAALLQKMPEGTYLHFSCHGIFMMTTPLDSYLALSGQQKLTLRDVLYGDAHPVRARLVVLSACQSAISDFLHLPDEYIGLPAGFLQAGVPGVVGTLWSVNDLSTALVMIKFYELHLRGDARTGQGPLSPTEALCRAQSWLREVTSGELTAYFTAHHQLNSARQRVLARLPEATVLAGLARFAWDDPAARPFAESPYHWAPFLFVGV